jgi:hypothetical protein
MVVASRTQLQVPDDLYGPISGDVCHKYRAIKYRYSELRFVEVVICVVKYSRYRYPELQKSRRRTCPQRWARKFAN